DRTTGEPWETASHERARGQSHAGPRCRRMAPSSRDGFERYSSVARAAPTSTAQQRLDVFVDRRPPFDEIGNARVFARLELFDGASKDNAPALIHGDSVADGERAAHVVCHHHAGDLQALLEPHDQVVYTRRID